MCQFQRRERTLPLHFTPPIFTQPVTLLPLTWMMDDDDGESDVGDDEWWLMMTVIMVMMVTFFFFLLFWAAQHSGAEYPNSTSAPIHHTSHPACRGPYRCSTSTARMTSSVLIMSTSLHTHVLAHVLHTSINSKLGQSISKVLAFGRGKFRFLRHFLPLFFLHFCLILQRQTFKNLPVPLQLSSLHYLPLLPVIGPGRVIHLGSQTRCGSPPQLLAPRVVTAQKGHGNQLCALKAGRLSAARERRGGRGVGEGCPVSWRNGILSG